MVWFITIVEVRFIDEHSKQRFERMMIFENVTIYVYFKVEYLIANYVRSNQENLHIADTYC